VRFQLAVSQLIKVVAMVQLAMSQLVMLKLNCLLAKMVEPRTLPSLLVIPYGADYCYRRSFTHSSTLIFSPYLHHHLPRLPHPHLLHLHPHRRLLDRVAAGRT
jgi:hypothetical protein